MKRHVEFGRTVQKLNTRGKILEAAHRLLEQHKSLSMETVAQEAGVSRATIYRYYSSTDFLATELVLHLNVPDAQHLSDQYKNHAIPDALLGIQNTYLNFILDNESASKAFLGAILSATDTKLERGQNRLQALRNYFGFHGKDLAPDLQEKLIHISVLLMGIESIIVSKDVCGLNDDESKQTLKWALEMILKASLNTS